VTEPLTLQDPKPTRDLASAPLVGCYPGVVVSGVDPLLAGAIRVRVDQVYGAASEMEKIEDADLPLARPCFPVTGKLSGSAWVPPVGAGVWVMFWGGQIEFPVWIGGFYGAGDTPTEFASSYAPEPKTRLVKVFGGHVFEMRWEPTLSEIRLQTQLGSFLRISDTPVPGVTVFTQGALSATAQGISLVSTGTAPTVHTGGGTLISTFTGAALYTFAGAVTYAVTGLWALVALGGFSVTAATVAIITTGTPVLLGTLAGIKQRLAHEQLFVLLQDFLFAYEAHTHVETGGTTSAPSLLPSSQAGSAPRAGPLTNVPSGNVSLDVTTMVTASVRAD